MELANDLTYFWECEPIEFMAYGYLHPEDSVSKNFKTKKQARADFLRFAKSALKSGSWEIVK